MLQSKIVVFLLCCLLFCPDFSLAGSLPRYFEVEIFPAVNNEEMIQDAIIYKFSMGNVSSSWNRTSFLGEGKKSILQVHLEGTFKNGVLNCTQHSRTTTYGPKGYYEEGFPDDAIARFESIGVIRGNAISSRMIKANVKTKIVKKEVVEIVPVLDNGEVVGYEPKWRMVDTEQPDPNFFEFWIPLPTPP